METVPYFTGDIEVRAQLAQLFYGMQQALDTFYSRYGYFLRTPANDFVSLGSLPGWPGGISNDVLMSLGINGSITGGIAGMDPAIFYEVWIERASDTHCVAYRMKPPFVGALRYCGENARRTNTVGYATGVWSWKAAMQAVCERVAKETASKCQDGFSPVLNLVTRDGSGNLSYVVAIRRELPGRPEFAKTPYFLYAQADYFVYRVDPSGEHMALLDHTDKPPEARYWQAQ